MTKTTIEPIEVPMTAKRKLSVAVGVLSMLAFLISQLSDVWGFGNWSKQLVDTMLIFSSVFSIYFGATTVQKHQDEKES